MVEVTPSELQSLINAAMFEIAKHPKNYKLAKNAAKKIYRWLIITEWDEPNEEIIFIDEKPF